MKPTRSGAVADVMRRAPPLPDWVCTDSKDRILARTRWPIWIVAATWAGIGFLAGVGFVLMVAP